MLQSILMLSLAVGTVLLATPQGAEAYIGPGAGIAAIGTVIALIGGIFLAMIAFVWYPIKRSLAKIKKRRGREPEGTSS